MSFRPKIYTEKIGLPLTPRLLERILAAAKAEDRSLAAYVRRLLEEQVPELPAPKKVRKKRSKK